MSWTKRRGDVRLLLGICRWSVLLPLLKRVLPLPVLVRLMHNEAREDHRDELRARRLARLVSRVLHVRGGDPNCLERSLILYRYLPLAGLDSELIIGFKKGVDRAPLGHAWLLVDEEPFEEEATKLEEYGVLLRFGPRGDIAVTPEASEHA